MAVPFNIPDDEEVANSVNVRTQSTTNSQPSTPTRPTSIPIRIENNSQPSSPQHSPVSPVDSEMLVQAFYEALCRCSQELPNFHISAPPTPSSPFNSGQHFWFPSPSDNFNTSSPSTSVFSSPRSSFRMQPNSRTRLNSYGNYSQHSHFSEDSGIAFENDTTNFEQISQIEEESENILKEVPQPKTKASNKKKPKDANKSSKITNLVISALQFVIDTLK